MSMVFISYRRQTAPGEARALFNDLVARLGQGAVFMDVDSISLGRDFRSELQKTLSACDSMLVLIDKDWAAVKDEKGQIRLQNAGDFVRMEIEAGLKRDIAVTPILIKGAQMPTAEELPAEIRDLAYRNGFELSHSRWESDVREMIRRLGLDVPEQGGQVETDRRLIAPEEAGDGSVPVDGKAWQKSRPLAFVQGAASGPTVAAEAADRGLEPPTARQPSRKPLVIAGVLGIICLGGVATWLTTPSMGTTTANLSRPQATPAQTLPAKDDRQSVASAQTNLGINYGDGLGGLPKDDREGAHLTDTRLETIYAPPKYDPVNTVRAFYVALSRADGNSAEAFMVPEKRGIGNFKADNITKFWGGLREPLKLLSIERNGNDFVNVKYSFTRPNGSVCLADANVNTIFTNGRTLIQGISATC
jgi:hypothetical protein